MELCRASGLWHQTSANMDDVTAVRYTAKHSGS